ncbi:GntR family transcriptional regulator [Streptomyces profundus]|uniref:GntR family transcriptional regulator n=1 Tax=Streptomyces profundus TaxID=2867410 RepID=UPI001D161BE0|nr:GntR family transcriptional regulator [Streptomyces sp. MA3_2.13]
MESAISVAGPVAGRVPPRRRSPLPVRPRSLPKRYSVRAQVLAALRDALASGELAAGETYSAPLLAERYGVSATPVREAMQRLASEGVVETVPNRGFRVTGRSQRDLAEVAEVRAALEIPALLALGRTLPRERWEELRPLADATVRVALLGDRAGYADADRAFHRELLGLTGNRHLVAVAQEMHRKAQSPRVGGRPAGCVELVTNARQHGFLLDALACGDLVTVERLARAHLAA